MTVQGDFKSREGAERAKAALIRSGIPVERIRVWNILPDNDAGYGGSDSAATGALVGGAVGGVTGVGVGAAIGEALGGDGPHLPDPSGVRVVVDVEGDAERIASSLTASGAAGIRFF